MSEVQIARSVDATGTVKQKYDKVSFSVEIAEVDQTGPTAKKKARPAVDAAQGLIETLVTEGVTIPTEDRRLEFSVAPNEVHTREGMKRDGYVACFTIRFATPDIAHASDIMDRLTEIEGTSVSAPQFSVADESALHKEALEKAVANAKALLAEECEVLGLEPDHYTLSSWRVHRGDRGMRSASAQGKFAMMAAAASSGPDPVELDPGSASVSVQVTLNYVHKG